MWRIGINQCSATCLRVLGRETSHHGINHLGQPGNQLIAVLYWSFHKPSTKLLVEYMLSTTVDNIELYELNGTVELH